MSIAKIFQSGNSQAVRLPRQYRFACKQVEIFRRGEEIVLREKPAKLSELLSGLPAWPEDLLNPEIPDETPQVRKAL